jgi:hypothetical protein
MTGRRCVAWKVTLLLVTTFWTWPWGSSSCWTFPRFQGWLFRSRSLVEQKSGLLRRVLAMTEIEFSNSLIEAFWRTLKHPWWFLNPLDSVAALRRHVAFYVAAHHAQVPHSAFRGQTPDEMYSGTGEQVPADLASAKSAALDARLNANRLLECERCATAHRYQRGSLGCSLRRRLQRHRVPAARCRPARLGPESAQNTAESSPPSYPGQRLASTRSGQASRTRTGFSR